MRNLIFFILLPLSLAMPCVGAAENRIDLPDGAMGALSQGEWTTGDLPSDQGAEHGGRNSHCYVFAIEPGSSVTVQLRSNAFDTSLAVMAGSNCKGGILYANDDVGPGSSDSALYFEAATGAYSVLVQGRSIDASGPYRLMFGVIESEGLGPARIPWSVSAPEVVVRSLYADSDYRVSDPEGFYGHFTPPLRQAFAALDTRTGGYGLGFDFLVDGQDADLSGFGMTLIALVDDEPANLALVDVRFLNFEEPVHLSFQLRELASGWRIEDVRSRAPQGGINWTLSALLEQELAAAEASE